MKNIYLIYRLIVIVLSVEKWQQIQKVTQYI